MKVLVVDRDELSASLAQTRLQELGHHAVVEPVKDNITQHLKSDEFDVVLLDPSPLNTADKMISTLRRGSARYTYILVFSESLTEQQAFQGGTNDFLQKPMDSDQLKEKMENALRLQALRNEIGNPSEEFPSAGGVIAKSAMNQLFLSALDRAGRYGERTNILFIGISNHEEVLNLDGRYALDYATSKLARNLVLIRRQSDIIGQTGRYEYALLLQSPVLQDQAIDAAHRFSENIVGKVIQDITRESSPHIQLSLSLVELPSGVLRFSQDISLSE